MNNNELQKLKDQVWQNSDQINHLSEQFDILNYRNKRNFKLMFTSLLISCALIFFVIFLHLDNKATRDHISQQFDLQLIMTQKILDVVLEAENDKK